MEHVHGHKIIYSTGQNIERWLTLGVIENILTKHLDSPFKMIRVFCQTVTTHPGSRPEDRPGDPLSFETINT